MLNKTKGNPDDHGVAEEWRSRTGDAIRVARTDAGLTQQQLADLVGVTKAAVSEWERGGSMPRIVHQVKIANNLKIAWAEMFGPDLGGAA